MELENEWVRISDDSGIGDTPVTATLKQVNTGRLTRSVTLKGTTAHDDEATATITQSSEKGEFVFFTQSSYAIGNSATSVTITGRSNSQRLTFVLTTEGTGITDFLNLPSTFMVTKADATTVTVSNGSDVTGDPGASAEYIFSITLTTKNTSPSNTRHQILNVTGYAGNTDATDISQAGIATTILFDGRQTGKVYDLTNTPVGGSQTINVGVSPSDEEWYLEFDE